MMIIDETKFSKEYPNLPIHQFNRCGKCGNELVEKERLFVPAENIPNSLIDKKKIEEVIDNFDSSAWDEADSFDVWLKRELKKRLGLTPELWGMKIVVDKGEEKRYCERCNAECSVKKDGKGKITSISCKKHPGDHSSGDFSYLCGCDYCRCCQ